VNGKSRAVRGVAVPSNIVFSFVAFVKRRTPPVFPDNKNALSAVRIVNKLISDMHKQQLVQIGRTHVERTFREITPERRCGTASPLNTVKCASVRYLSSPLLQVLPPSLSLSLSLSLLASFRALAIVQVMQTRLIAACTRGDFSICIMRNVGARGSR